MHLIGLKKNVTIAQHASDTAQFSGKVGNALVIQMDATSIEANLHLVSLLIQVGSKLVYSGTAFLMSKFCNMMGGMSSGTNTALFYIDIGSWYLGNNELTIQITNSFATSIVVDVYVIHDRVVGLPSIKYSYRSDESFGLDLVDMVLCSATALDEHAGVVNMISNEGSNAIPVSGAYCVANTKYRIETEDKTMGVLYHGLPKDFSVNIDDAGGNAITVLARGVYIRSLQESGGIQTSVRSQMAMLNMSERKATRQFARRIGGPIKGI